MGQTEGIETEDGVGHPRVGGGGGLLRKAFLDADLDLKSLEFKEMEDIGIST